MFRKIVFFFFVFFLIVIILFSYISFARFGQKTYLGKIYSGDGKKAKLAYLDTPQGFAKDKVGNFYIADTMNNVIRKIDAKTKKISTLAGTDDFGSNDGLWNKATFSFPEGIDVDREGNVYITDPASGKIRKYDRKTGLVFTLFSGLRQPKDVMLRGNELYIADTGNNRILRSNIMGAGLIKIAEIFCLEN